MPYGDGLAGAGVVVAVLAWVKDAGNGLQGGFGDLGAHSGLTAGLVPQHGNVEDLEQPGLEPGRQVRQHVAGQRETVQQSQVGGDGRGLGEGLELGFEAFAFAVEFGEPGADAGAERSGGGIGRVGGQFFEFEDLGVLRGLDRGDAGLDRGDLGVPVGGSGGVSSRELGGQEGGAFGAEDAGWRRTGRANLVRT
jgi:hypothetical protein